MKTETLEYRDGGTICRGLYVHDETKSGKRPGLLIAPDIRGVGLRPGQRVQELARLGYAVLIADMYGNGTTMRDFPHGMELIKQVRSSTAGWRSRIAAAAEALAARPEVDGGQIGAIGYCFGGSTVLELALSGADNVKAVVSLHGGLDGLGLQDAGRIRSKILVCTGAEDPLVPVANVTALEQAFRDAKVADWQVVTYGGTKHSFTDPETPDTPNTAYNKTADERSWASLQALFREALT